MPTAKTLIAAITLAVGVFPAIAPASATEQSVTQNDESQTLIALSRQKWLWMADRDMPQLEALFHPSARFVHMSRTMNRTEELEVIRSGGIHYKQADVSDISVEMVGDTAIVYSRIRLLAVVGGNEVSNPFSATEVYVRQGNQWQLATLAFSRLVGD
jgi:Domain of unknown function (DUF4440)